MTFVAGKQNPRAKPGMRRRNERFAIGFLVVMGIALVAVGYLWVKAQQDRQSLTVYATGLPPS